MNGYERRHLEITHPELIPTEADRERKWQRAKRVCRVVKSFVFVVMTILSVLVVLISRELKGNDAFMAVLLGTLISVIIGMLLAYRIGKRIEQVLA